MSTDDKKGFFDGPTRRVGGGASQQSGSQDDNFFGGKTRVVNENGSSTDTMTQQSSTQDFNDKTRRAGPSVSAGHSSSSAEAPSRSIDQAPEFVVGWLVITEGPGRGLSKPLGYGMNSIGRGEDVLIRLDYGDEEISRSAHCYVAYDHKNKKFYIQHGGGQNLTYLGSHPVLASSELLDKAEISIGKTTMTFIQLCNDSFDWESDTES